MATRENTKRWAGLALTVAVPVLVQVGTLVYAMGEMRAMQSQMNGTVRDLQAQVRELTKDNTAHATLDVRVGSLERHAIATDERVHKLETKQ